MSGSGHEAPLRVLLVEDNVVHARFVGTVLEQLGRPCSVHHAGSVRSACDRLRAETFDVVLADVHLPDGQGPDVMARLSEAAPHVPLVAVSAVDDPAVVQAVLVAGAHDLLTKDRLTPELLGHAMLRAAQRSAGAAATRGTQLLDPSTGLFNRQGLEMATAKTLAFARRQRHGVTVVHLEVGATPAEMVEVAAIVARTVRDADLVGRLGPAHLTLVLPDDRSDPPAALGRVRGRLGETALAGLSLDVVVRRFDPEQPVTAGEILRVAPAGDVTVAATEPRRRAIVVSEDESVRDAVRSVLGAGWTLLEASGPGQAARLAALEDPHVVIVDLARADGDGLGIVRRVAEQPEVPGVPIVGIDGVGYEVASPRAAGLVAVVHRQRLVQDLGYEVERLVR